MTNKTKFDILIDIKLYQIYDPNSDYVVNMVFEDYDEAKRNCIDDYKIRTLTVSPIE